MRRECITFLRVYVLPTTQPLGSDVRGYRNIQVIQVLGGMYSEECKNMSVTNVYIPKTVCWIYKEAKLSF